jgi:hypothetical protein
MTNPHLLQKIGTPVLIIWFLALLFLAAAVTNS